MMKKKRRKKKKIKLKKQMGKCIFIILIGITIFFGSIGLITNSLLKFWAIISAFSFMVIGLFAMRHLRKKQKLKTKK